MVTRLKPSIILLIVSGLNERHAAGGGTLETMCRYEYGGDLSTRTAFVATANHISEPEPRTPNWLSITRCDRIGTTGTRRKADSLSATHRLSLVRAIRDADTPLRLRARVVRRGRPLRHGRHPPAPQSRRDLPRR
jgi:hypothetical protein